MISLDNQSIAGYSAGLFELLGSFPYFYAIITKKMRPSRATWLIWSLGGIILFFSYYASGARETLWQPGVSVLWNILFAILTLKYGVGGKTKTDIFCFVGALASALLWYLTKNPVVALTCIVVIALIGSFPTLVKVYKKPASENKLAWFFWALAGLSNLAAIKSWNYSIAFYPIECAVIASLIFLLVFRRFSNKN